MSKRKLLFVGLAAGIALTAWGAVAPQAHAVTSAVTITNATISSTTLGATSTLTYSLTFNQAVGAGSGFGFNLNGMCPWEEPGCGFDFSGATLTGLTGNADPNENGINFGLTSGIANGATKTVTISGLTNPSAARTYTAELYVNIDGSPPGSEPVSVSYSTPLFMGDFAVKGRVKMPNGTPVAFDAGVNVNVRDENFSVNLGAGVGADGWFGIPTQSNNEWNQGTITSGNTYFIEVWTGQLNGVVSPDPISFVYNGSPVSKAIFLVAAKKTLNISVQYDGTDDPVTTANIWANKRSGGGGIGGDTDANGEASFSVSGGEWEVMLNCGWDKINNRPADCDWTYNEPPKMVQFSNDSSVESEDLVFEVKKTNAKIKGTVYLADGTTPLPGGFVDIRAGERGGAGVSINHQDGTFTANVTAGDYKLSVFADNQNPDLARYYTSEISVRVGENQTKTLTIIMKQKTSKISGKVLDQDGKGVQGVWLHAWVRDGQGWGDAQSGADGSYTMWVSPGDWEINIDSHRDQRGGVSYIPADSKPVSVIIGKNETKSGVNLRVQQSNATANIKIVNSDGAAITDMWGYAYCRKKDGGWGPGNEFGSGVDRGTATIPLLGGFTYVCGMHMPPEGERSLQSEPEVTIAVGQNKDIKLTLVENDSKIFGWIKDQDGKIITGQGNGGEVFAVEAGNWQWRPGKLNDDGSYEISLLGGTGKSFMVGVHFWGAEKGESEFIESHPEPDDSVSVPANSEVMKIVTVFRANTSISGTVYDPDGNPMSRVWVGADNFEEHEGKLKGDFEGGKVLHIGTETRADGTFRLQAVSDTWRLHSGMPPEYESDFMSPKEVEVTATSDAPVKGVKMYYRQADAFINATVEFADGSSPDFGWCWAWSEEGGNSGRDVMGGSSRIPVTAGTWQVGCDTFMPESNKFYRAQEKQITLVVGDTKSLSFTLEEANFIVPEPFSQTFTATQQNVFTLPNGDSVTLPANAAGTDESTYTFSATPNTSLFFTDDSKPLMYSWNFEITKQSDTSVELVESFNSNATICMNVPKAVLDDLGVTADDLFAKYYDTTSGTWKLPESAVVTLNDDGSANACLQTSHFTEFAMTTSVSFGAAGSGGPAYVVATPHSAGGPQVTVWDGDGAAKLNFFAYDSTQRFGIQAVAGDVDGDGENEIVVAPGAGAGPHVRVFSLTGDLESQFFAYASDVRAGLNLVVSDVTGDGVDDIVIAAKNGAGPHIRIFDATGGVLGQFFAYASTFRGGVTLAADDIDGDGVNEIITIPESASAPQVRTFDYDGTVVSGFFAYDPSIRGSFHLSTGDIDGDGTADIVVSAGPGLGPQVAMFTGGGDLIGRFFAYASTFRGGMFATVGDVSGDGVNEIVATPESGAGPHIRIFDTGGNVVSQFFAYATHLRGAFTSIIADIDQDGTSDVVTAPGPGMGPHVRVFDYAGNPVAQFFTHHTGFRGGIDVSSVPAF